MITLHTWSTPNGRKISIMLEECGLPYAVHAVNIGKDEQFDAAFLAIAPNNKIPAIVDDEAPGGPLALFESGAILTYLAEKTGRFLAPTGPARWQAQQWLHWQIGGLGPMLGQLGFFAVRSDEKAPLAIKRFTEEADRLLHVMDKRLAAAPYLAGDEYSIADIACYAWTLAATTFLKEPLAATIPAIPPRPGVARHGGRPPGRAARHGGAEDVMPSPRVQPGFTRVPALRWERAAAADASPARPVDSGLAG